MTQIDALEYLKQTLVTHPNDIAVIDPHIQLSFQQLARAIQKLSQRLKVSRQPIAVLLPKSSLCLASLLACTYSNNFYVPLDTETPAPRLKAILDNLEPAAIFTQQPWADKLHSLGFPENRTLLIEENWHQSLPQLEPFDLPANRIDTDPAYIIYTSGSTGTPKGVVISHRSIIDYIEWARATFPLQKPQRIASQAPFYFDNSVLDIYLCLSTASTLYIPPAELFAFPIRILEYLQKHQITFLFWVPFILTQIANSGALEHSLPQSLEQVLFAGEVMPTRTLRLWQQTLPNVLFANLYGPTEITVDCTFYIANQILEDSMSLPIGFPCRNTDILVLNEENLPVSGQEVGELCVRGSSLALGYWNSPEKTAAAFVQNPLNPHYPERIYRTGDLVYSNQHGELIFVGRADSQIKHLGYRIELGEIETALLSLPEIQHGCVLYHVERKEITAFFESATSLSARELRQKLLALLPKYMVPVQYHQLTQLPRNPNGKIDRLQLRKQFFEGA